MSLDKAVAKRWEHRRPYRGSRVFDPACRSGTCPWCYSNNTIQAKRAQHKGDDEMRFDADESALINGRLWHPVEGWLDLDFDD